MATQIQLVVSLCSLRRACFCLHCVIELALMVSVSVCVADLQMSPRKAYSTSNLAMPRKVCLYCRHVCYVPVHILYQDVFSTDTFACLFPELYLWPTWQYHEYGSIVYSCLSLVFVSFFFVGSTIEKKEEENLDLCRVHVKMKTRPVLVLFACPESGLLKDQSNLVCSDWWQNLCNLCIMLLVKRGLKWRHTFIIIFFTAAGRARKLLVLPACTVRNWGC